MKLYPVELYFELTRAIIFLLLFVLTELSILNDFILGTQNVNPKRLLFC